MYLFSLFRVGSFSCLGGAGYGSDPDSWIDEMLGDALGSSSR